MVGLSVMSIGQTKTWLGRRFGLKRDRSHWNAAAPNTEPLYAQLKWEVVLRVRPVFDRKDQMEDRAVCDWHGLPSLEFARADQPGVSRCQPHLACAKEVNMLRVEGQPRRFRFDQ